MATRAEGDAPMAKPHATNHSLLAQFQFQFQLLLLLPHCDGIESNKLSTVTAEIIAIKYRKYVIKTQRENPICNLPFAIWLSFVCYAMQCTVGTTVE